MTKKIRIHAITLASVALIVLAWVIPAAGTSVGPFQSLDCSVTGNTWRPSGGLSIRSTTSAYYNGGGNCGYGYLSANYYQGGTWVGYGPGWIAGGHGDTGPQTALDAVVSHSGCHAGGPCGGAAYDNTYD